jgi:hypothetical protein
MIQFDTPRSSTTDSNSPALLSIASLWHLATSGLMSLVERDSLSLLHSSKGDESVQSENCPSSIVPLSTPKVIHKVTTLF